MDADRRAHDGRRNRAARTADEPTASRSGRVRTGASASPRAERPAATADTSPARSPR